MVGELAKSKAGHDKDYIYVIIKEENEYVYLADGKLRTFQKPKKKKLKHVQMIHEKCSEQLYQQLLHHDNVQNEEIKYHIKNYLNNKHVD